MRNISDIFPPDYPHPCSEEDLRFEVQDILRHADSPMDIIHSINKIQCPYYRKAIATLIPPNWHEMERLGKEPAVFLDSEGDWRITWINIDCDMRAIIKTANHEQLQLEQPNPSTPYTLHPTPSTPYTLHPTLYTLHLTLYTKKSPQNAIFLAHIKKKHYLCTENS